MAVPPQNPWDATRSELRDFSVAVLLFDTIAIGLGGFLSRPLGTEMWLMGAVVAAWVNICFVVLIACDLTIDSLLGWRAARRQRGLR